MNSEKPSRPRLPWLDTRQGTNPSTSHLGESGASSEDTHQAPTRLASNTSSAPTTTPQYPSFANAAGSTVFGHCADASAKEKPLTGQTASPPQPMTVTQSPAALFLAAFGAAPVTTTAPAPPLPDDEGQPIAGGYILGPVIGHGGFSIIRKAHSPNGSIVAVKIVRHNSVTNASPSNVNSLNTESALWSCLHHEHVLPLFSFSHTPYASYFVTLYCPAGSLFDILKRDGRPALPHDDAGTLFRQVVRGVRYLHEGARVVHRDIKLENVLLDEMGSCRIADFGMAVSIDEDVSRSATDDEDNNDKNVLVQRRSRTQSRTTVDGTHTHATVNNVPGANLTTHLSLSHRPHLRPARHRASSPFPSTNGQHTPAHPYHTFQPGSLPYAAPELLLPPHQTKSRPGSGTTTPNGILCAKAKTKGERANPAQDVWALGILLYALLTGKLPFWDGFEPRLQMKILHGAYDIPNTIGPGAERVLQGCLEKDVNSRWTIDLVDDAAWGIGDSETEDEKHDLEHHHAHHVEFDEPVGNNVIGTRTRSRSKPPTPSSGGSNTKSKSRSRTRPYPSHEAVAKVHPGAHPWFSNEREDESARRNLDSIDTTSAFLQRGRRTKRDITTPPTTDSLVHNHQLDQEHKSPQQGHHQVWTPSPGPSVISTSNTTSDNYTYSHSRSRSRSVPPRTPSDVFGFASRTYGEFEAEDELGEEHGEEEMRKKRMSSRSRVRSVRYEEVIDEGEDCED